VSAEQKIAAATLMAQLCKLSSSGGVPVDASYPMLALITLVVEKYKARKADSAEEPKNEVEQYERVIRFLLAIAVSQCILQTLFAAFLHCRFCCSKSQGRQLHA
jgi:hypothetical protein